ncbi:MAG TPA: GNAT family N-acetyltransferase [Epulopiscium sp.]|nr:GNAT family N-acetyltransferase [Candidatus Epulonipiscium sp.]
MVEIRLAKKGEEIYQKSLWKACFGDEQAYIDFYFLNKYKAEETAVLLYKGEIVAMTTMIPGKLVTAGGQVLELAMLYAVATDPKHQGKGFSTQIMDFCNKHLIEKGVGLSILVPAEASLFDFYSKRGYKEAFYVREVTLTYDQIAAFKTNINQEVSMIPIEASDYNNRRRTLLAATPYVDYNNEELDYQKKLSKEFGADLYCINIGDIKGCAIVEWIDQNKIFIKEILMPDHLIKEGLKKIAQLLPAKDYMVRLPTDLGGNLGGIIRPFGMMKIEDTIQIGIKDEMLDKKQGYMGIAYD